MKTQSKASPPAPAKFHTSHFDKLALEAAGCGTMSSCIWELQTA